MSMLAVQERPRAADPNERMSRVADEGQTTGINPQLLRTAIEHHRSESRRLADVIKRHRIELKALLRQRDQHIAELRAANWQPSKIGALYNLTQQRIQQIIRDFRLTNGGAR